MIGTTIETVDIFDDIQVELDLFLQGGIMGLGQQLEV